ncbi:hypothetical protein FB451DRAFT_1561165, partial [Mycena latifolia]
MFVSSDAQRATARALERLPIYPFPLLLVLILLCGLLTSPDVMPVGFLAPTARPSPDPPAGPPPSKSPRTHAGQSHTISAPGPFLFYP